MPDWVDRHDVGMRGHEPGKNGDGAAGNRYWHRAARNLNDPGPRSHVTGVNRPLARVEKQWRRG